MERLDNVFNPAFCFLDNSGRYGAADAGGMEYRNNVHVSASGHYLLPHSFGKQKRENSRNAGKMVLGNRLQCFLRIHRMPVEYRRTPRLGISFLEFIVKGYLADLFLWLLHLLLLCRSDH